MIYLNNRFRSRYLYVPCRLPEAEYWRKIANFQLSLLCGFCFGFFLLVEFTLALPVAWVAGVVEPLLSFVAEDLVIGAVFELAADAAPLFPGGIFNVEFTQPREYEGRN
jgi:hypothetical protein